MELNRRVTMKTRTTLADVAAHAGVSRSTASLVLRQSGQLSSSTRERVRSAMEELGYVYHRGAASLRATRSQSVGVIVSDMSNAFNAELTVALESALAESGIIALTANTLERVDRQDLLVRSMLERQVDGILVIPAVESSANFSRDLAMTGVPTVIASRWLSAPDIPFVGVDNVKGGLLASEHLLSHDVRNLAYLGGFDRLGPRNDRIEGVRQALQSVGSHARLTVNLPGPPTSEWGLAMGRELMRGKSLPDGIICHTDQVAFGFLRALRERRRSRKSIHVVSFDDVKEAALWEPPLTTVAASGADVGVRCAEKLLRRIAEPDAPARQFLVEPHLVVRESCGCPSSRAQLTA